MRRSVGGVLTLVLATGVLVGLAPGPASADIDVIAREAKLTIRPSVLPADGSTESQQLESASVRQEISGYRVRATVVLRAAPGAGATLKVGFGTGSAANCVIDPESQFSTPTTGTMSEGFSRSGRVFTLDADSIAARTEDWTCAAVALGVTSTLDQLSGPLTDIHGKPALTISDVRLLRKKPKQLKLVKGDWTTLEVTVRNSAPYNAPALRVTGSGKGLRVKPASYDVVYRNGGEGTVRIRVKLTGKRKKSTLRLRASSRGVTAARAIKVKRVKPARKPANGRYRAKVKGSKAKVTFRIKKGRIVGFKGQRLRMRCQTPGDYATYQNVNLRHPKKVKISRAGRVDAEHRWRKGGAWYNTWLQMQVRGAKVTQGSFTYVTANWCRVTIRFNARRIGR